MFGAVKRMVLNTSAFLGRQVFLGVKQWRELSEVALRTAYFTLRGGLRLRRWREIVNQMYQVGNRSLLFIVFTMGFFGMILTFQSAIQVKRIIGNLDLLGPVFLKNLVRDWGPSIGALMIATRVGSGIAAEIGSMVVTDQVNALRMSSADPVDYLIVPRFIATTIMVVVLSIISVFVAHMAGALTAHHSFQVSYETYMGTQFVEGLDVIMGLTKAVAYGMTIPILAGWCGLATTGGSEGVGWSTTKAVVATSFAVIFLNVVISTVFYFIETAIA